ncbi:MAG: carboxypeptidase-like regulatory domain-containing protein [Tannerella sp.]|jgi:hypothetical protein|nr:carboxypeptidase-like regulatory domain-containing protein [Tannerella sp.]
MKYLLPLFLTLFFLTESLNAQQIEIKGIVLDSKDKSAVPYANIVLMHPDSTFIEGTITDNKGNFALSNIQKGNYTLKISCIGYLNNHIAIRDLKQNHNIGTVMLEEQSVNIQDITVTASHIISKTDRQIILPNQYQIKNSSTGFDILNKMMLPGIKVDLVQNAISTIGGESVQLRINDIKASTQQVLALQPDEILRVEYIDNPGVRYANEDVSAIINFIIRYKISGLSAGVNLTNSFTTGFGNDNLYIRANHKRSEFGLNYYMTYRDYDDRYVDEEQQFTLKNGQLRNRTLEGISVPFNYTTHDLEFSYNLTQPDNYIFNLIFKESFFDAPNRDYSQRIYENGVESTTSYTGAKDKSNKPALDIYFMKKLPRKQNLTVNVVGTFTGTDYSRTYNEYVPDNSTPLEEFGYSTDGNRYSFIGEAIYDKEFKPFKLSSGIQYTQAYTKNIYEGTTDAVTRMHNSDFYIYSQLQGSLQKLSYIIGAGVSHQHFDENNTGYNFYTFRPSVMFSYPVFSGASLRYTFNVNPSLPSLSDLSDIRQQINDFEVNVGNPHLKPYRTYRNQLRFQYQYKHLNTQLTGSYSYSKNPIMGDVNRVDFTDGYLFEYISNNQKSFSNLGVQGYLQYQLIPDMFSLSGYFGVNHYNSEGNQYKHNYTAWFGGGNAQFSLGNWSLGGWYGSRYNSFYGQNINYGENNSGINLSYKIKEVRIGAGWWYPLNSEGWSAGGKTLADIAKKERWTYISDNGNMLTLSFSWNINYGRKYEAGKKTLNNADYESGIVK